MKSYLKNIFLFIGILTISYPVLIIFTGFFIPQLFHPNISYKLGAYGHMFTRINEVKRTQSIDILFLGSSHAYRGFDNRNFEGLKTFNLGSSSQTPIQTQVLLNRYLNNLNPKMIIYEVFPGPFTGDGVESSLDLMSNDKNDYQSIEMALEVNNIKVYNTFIYSVFRDFLNLNQSFLEPNEKENDTYISGGFVESKIKHYKYHGSTKREWNFNKNQLKAFNENLNLLKQKNIQTILVYAPITKSLYNSYQNNNYVDSLMNSYDLSYYNFNNLVSLNDSIDFNDDNHLNQNGVIKFNEKFIHEINLK
jgi:hypothetical protein